MRLKELIYSRVLKIVITLAFTVVSFVYVLLATRHFTLGFTPDSIEYYDLANSLLNGTGFTDYQGNFVNHWPPFYSLFLALISFVSGLSIHQSGILLSAVCSGIIFLFFNYLQTILSIQNNIIRLLLNAVLFLILLPNTMLWFLSEGLFIVLMLVFVTYFLKWNTSEKWWQLILASFTLGVMFITRYAAIGFVLALAIIVITKLVRTRNWTQFIRNGLLSSLSFVLVVTPWLLFSKTQTESATSRVVGFHPIGSAHILDLERVLSNWLAPSSNSVISTLVFTVVGIVMIVLLVKFRSWHNSESLRVLFYCIVSYLVLLVVSMSFFDAATPFDHRILSPILPLGLLVVGVISRAPKAGILVGIILLISVGSNFQPFVKRSLGFYNQGLGYTSVWWKESETIRAIRELDLPSDLVFTNNYYALRLHFPELAMKEKGLRRVGTSLPDHSSILVFYTHSNTEVNPDTLNAQLEGQGELIKLSDGFIIRSTK